MFKRGEKTWLGKHWMACFAAEFSTESLALGFSCYADKEWYGAIRLELLVFVLEFYYQVH